MTCALASVAEIPGNTCFGDELLLLIVSSDSKCYDHYNLLIVLVAVFGG